MKKKYFLLSVAGILIVVISFSLGYIYAYIHWVFKDNDMRISIYSDILITNSATLTEKLKSTDIAELIEATEENGDFLSSLIIVSKPRIKDPETLKYIEISLTSWEKAKGRLRELKALQSNESSNPESK